MIKGDVPWLHLLFIAVSLDTVCDDKGYLWGYKYSAFSFITIDIWLKG